MKYKIKSACEKQALMHLMEGKYDWVLLYGVEKDSCYQIQCLFRNVLCDRKHANCVDSHGNYLRHEQLTFQSRKAAVRWVKKHTNMIIEDYKKRNGGRRPYYVQGFQWRGNSTFVINI